MNNPTDEQAKEFWEWCGFKQLDNGKRAYHFECGTKVMDWMPPDKQDWFYSVRSLPRIDLNNLFKYAVPKLQKEIGMITLVGHEDGNFRCIIRYFYHGQIAEMPDSLANDKDPALALFWTIMEVIHETD